jgi:transcriptional regulator with XRE-family HTH domain
MNKVIIDFGKKLRLLRNEQRITQEELSKRTGLTQNYISKLEHGEKNLTLITFLKIIKALGVSSSSFIDNKKEPDEFAQVKTIDFILKSHTLKEKTILISILKAASEALKKNKTEK